MSEPWYQKGLKFKCTECGKCCTGSPGFVWVTDQEIAAMAAYLKLSEDKFRRQYLRFRDGRYALVEMRKRNHDCIFLKDNKCSIYPVRPKQCRTFPWWKQNLKTPEAWEAAAEYCEGINREDAPVTPLHVIQDSCH